MHVSAMFWFEAKLVAVVAESGEMQDKM